MRVDQYFVSLNMTELKVVHNIEKQQTTTTIIDSLNQKKSPWTGAFRE